MLTDPNLKSKVDALWDRFWSGGISNPLSAIEQMSYLIFLKRLEDMDNSRAAVAKEGNKNINLYLRVMKNADGHTGVSFQKIRCLNM